MSPLVARLRLATRAFRATSRTAPQAPAAPAAVGGRATRATPAFVRTPTAGSTCLFSNNPTPTPVLAEVGSLKRDVQVRIRVPEVYATRRPTVKPPSGAAPGDTFFCRYPFAPHEHLIAGSDGSIFDEAIGGWIPKEKLEVGTVDIQGAPVPPIQRSQCVLVAHGHTPVPYADSVVLFRDQTPANCALPNLFWLDLSQTENHPELVKAIDDAAAAAPAGAAPLRFTRLLPWFPSLHIGTDGRVYDHRLQQWLAETDRGEIVTQISKGPNRLEEVHTHRYLLVWAAHAGRGQLPITSRIEYADGNSKNCAIANLKEVPNANPDPKAATEATKCA